MSDTADQAQISGAHLTSSAVVVTDRGARYAKQLASHLGRRLETTWDDEAGEGDVRLDGGRCELSAGSEQLTLLAQVDPATTGDDGSALLARIEDVVGRHLVRFGARDELVVAWQHADGSPGGVFRNSDDPEPEHTRPA